MRIGQLIIVNSGPIRGLEGKITAIDLRKHRCKVQLYLYEESFIVDFRFDVLTVRNEWLSAITSKSQPYIIHVQKNLVKELEKDPDRLQGINARDFEFLIAELLNDMGYETIITQHTKDKGRDILASIQTPIGQLLTTVECKRNRSNRPIGIEPVQRLLWVADNIDKASSAMLVTTSTFTRGARAIERDHKYRLYLRDYQDITAWLEAYGQTSSIRNNSLWMPKQSLDDLAKQ